MPLFALFAGFSPRNLLVSLGGVRENQDRRRWSDARVVGCSSLKEARYWSAAATIAPGAALNG